MMQLTQNHLKTTQDASRTVMGRFRMLKSRSQMPPGQSWDVSAYSNPARNQPQRARLIENQLNTIKLPSGSIDVITGRISDEITDGITDGIADEITDGITDGITDQKNHMSRRHASAILLRNQPWPLATGAA